MKPLGKRSARIAMSSTLRVTRRDGCDVTGPSLISGRSFSTFHSASGVLYSNRHVPRPLCRRIRSEESSAASLPWDTRPRRAARDLAGFLATRMGAGANRSWNHSRYSRLPRLHFLPYSHSLLADLIWGTLLGLLYFAIRRHAREAVIVGLCVPSHWLLDFIAHRPDMQIVPGGPRYGLGLWNSVPATLAVEILFYAVGIGIYVKGTRPSDRTGTYALWSLLVFLLVAYLGSAFGPPPPDTNVLAFTAPSLIWLPVPWAAWADRHRSSAAC